MFRKKLILLAKTHGIAFLLLFCCSSVSAQTTVPYQEHLSGFIMTSLTGKISPNWMIYVELQGRSVEKFSKPDYYEIKGGGGYNFNPDNQAFIGIGRYANYTKSSLSQEELRLWLQYTLTTYISRLRLENRVRAEERLFHKLPSNDRSTDQRYRYRLNAILPLNHDKLVAKTFFVTAFDEIFAGPKDPTFKRNRLYAGGGYQFDKHAGISTGYMWQRELSTTPLKSLHFLYLALNFVIDKKDIFKDRHIDVPVAD